MTAINDISDKGRKQSKRLRYEVGILHRPNDNDEQPEIMARFSHYGDARAFAEHVAQGNIWYAGVVIRS